MGDTDTRILVAVEGDQVWFQITGRATFTRANDFRVATETLANRGCHRFTVDLSGCVSLDSTFIGVLAGLARRLRRVPEGRVALGGLSERLAHQIGSLGILPMFAQVAPGEPSGPLQTVAPVKADSATMARVALEAHQNLMAENPENVARYQDVADMFAAELKQLGGGT